MANIVTIQREVPKPVPKAVITSLTIKLNLDEAKAIRNMLYVTGGLPKTTRRKHTDNVYNELIDAIGSRHSLAEDIDGHLRFLQGKP